MVTYKEAGVDIEKGERFVEYIKRKVKKTGGFFDTAGGFGAGFEIKGFKNPVVVTSADGVGTKLKIAQLVNIHNTVGIDLVAMNANDVLTSGVFPTFFLDYIASGRIKIEILKEIMEGILKGCEMAGIVLIGGETAEMPSFYPDNVYDLAGFCMGIGEKDDLANPDRVREGDVLIGIRSRGLHSNGYSLVRKIVEESKITYDQFIDEFNCKLYEALLEPTVIYVPYIKKLKSKGINIKASAHITGGGIEGNLKRIVPEGLRAVVEKNSIPKQSVFEWIQEVGGVEEGEMYRTFNMGVGYILIVEEKFKDQILDCLAEEAFVCGYIEKGKGEVLLI